MMSPDNLQPKAATRDETQSSGGRKTTPMKPPEQALNCPRCDSPNTKFCYYNNYSLTQPRHFCKTCRRYWTKGGALRNVPIGGGCRKNKKTKSSSRISGDSKDSSGETSDMGGLKFFHGLSPPAMDFQLGGLSLSRLNSSTTPNTTTVFNQFSSYVDTSNSNPIPSNPGFGINDPSRTFNFNQELGTVNVHSHIASSIESLSSINQDLHWKLQQQRLAMLFGGSENHQKSNDFTSTFNLENQTQKSQPISFQSLEISKPEACDVGNSRKDSSSGNNNMATEWFFDNAYAPVNMNNTPSNSNGNGIQAWSDLNQYSALP